MSRFVLLKKKRAQRRAKASSSLVATKGYVKRQLSSNMETKYHLVSGQQSVSDTASVITLSSLTQGTTDQTRTGDRVKLKSIYFKYEVNVADTTNKLRVILFQWKMNSNHYTPTMSDIIQNSTSLYSGLFLSPYTHDTSQMKSYTVLYDRVHHLSTDTSVASNAIQRGGITRVPMKYVSKNLQFDSATTNGTNKIFMLVVSDSSAISHPYIDYTARIEFTDA